MQFAILGSGSKGNATLVRADNTALLIDCGFTVQETLNRMAAINFDPMQLSAILVTHEHGDHSKGVVPLSRRLGVPVYASAGTAIALKWHDKLSISVLSGGQLTRIGDLEVLPVVVPHDAREAYQFVISSPQGRLGILTDLGHITPHVVEAYQDIDVLLLEANHDLAMLEAGPYPPALKRRVGGPWGHLNNQQSAEFLQQLNLAQLQHIVIAHISGQNNDPEQAQAVLSEAIPEHAHKLIISQQDQPSDWCCVKLEEPS